MQGGTAEFLHLLLALNLADFHPRQVPKTDELVEQQIMRLARSSNGYLRAPRSKPLPGWCMAP